MAKNELVKGEYLTDLQKLDGNTLRNFVDPKHRASPQELQALLAIVKNRNLNPFTKEVYFIKYGSAPAQIVVSKEAIMKRAEENPNFDGFEAGIVIETKSGSIERLTGTIAPKRAELRGGWCKVYRKDRSHAIEADADFAYYTTGKNLWQKMPALMIRKVAIVSAFREAFSESVGGLYTADEMEQNNTQETQEEVRARRMKQAYEEKLRLLTEMEAKSYKKVEDESASKEIEAAKTTKNTKEVEVIEETEVTEEPTQEDSLEW
ncbi:RecT-like ssDNA annealing protein [Streptococcus phage APCM01]|uniref:RecT-like ssDNA annealing protein n=1 Tax=Streptococcus phage APCM01 TaxID=1647391 RepID=UPI00067A7349|nr:RecT-like ssDNA annealing protein [Streptococcus phage APCM01]AKI28587.1 RecT family single-strand annealing protein [Streptococcus phage APCM01]